MSDDEEEEFGHTQIIPSVDEIEPLGSVPTLGEISSGPKKSEASLSSQDLMDELESLIGKKVDELIQ